MRTFRISRYASPGPDVKIEIVERTPDGRYITYGSLICAREELEELARKIKSFVAFEAQKEKSE